MINILIADDQPLIGEALTSIFRRERDFTVLGLASDGIAAVSRARELKPDVVMMDIRMPVMDGFAACQRITSDPTLVRTKVLMLSTFEDDENVVRSIRAGASGFVGKSLGLDALVEAVRLVNRGEVLLSPRAAQALTASFVSTGSRTDIHPTLERLTEREREILDRVARGMDNVQIGLQFAISPATVKTHVNRMMSKLEVHDRSQLVVLAYETGLLVPQAPKTPAGRPSA